MPFRYSSSLCWLVVSNQAKNLEYVMQLTFDIRPMLRERVSSREPLSTDKNWPLKSEQNSHTKRIPFHWDILVLYVGLLSRIKRKIGNMSINFWHQTDVEGKSIRLLSKANSMPNYWILSWKISNLFYSFLQRSCL